MFSFHIKKTLDNKMSSYVLVAARIVLYTSNGRSRRQGRRIKSFRLVRLHLKLISAILKITLCKNYSGMLGIVAYAFDPSSFKVEGGRTLSPKPAYSEFRASQGYTVSGTLSQKQRNYPRSQNQHLFCP